MNGSDDATIRLLTEELETLYDGAAEGILVVDFATRHFIRASRAMCELLGYSQDELLSLSVEDIHPRESLPNVLGAFEAMGKGELCCARNVPCLRKDRSIIHVDVAATHLIGRPQPLMVCFFRDVTEQNRTIELLRKSEQRYRLIADHVADVIWTAPLSLSAAERAAAKVDLAKTVDKILERWRFSFASPAVERVFGYTAEEATVLPLADFVTPVSFARIRDAITTVFLKDSLTTIREQQQQSPVELQCIHKDGSVRWCEAVAAYMRDENGIPTGILGITRDITQRRQAEKALRESESMLRKLFENLPDIVLTADRNANIHFVNRDTAPLDRNAIVNANGFQFIAEESQDACHRAIEAAFASGQPQTVECCTVFGHWWSCRLVPLDKEGGAELVMIICTEFTKERLAAEAVQKEQRLLRQLLELHERERRLIAYEIHDGFAQQLTGALFRLQASREVQARDPTQAAENFDSAMLLISRAIDETRRLISGLRPPILDESGIIEAIEYLVCEYTRHGGPSIEFTHDVQFERLAPALEIAVFRIVQEALQNACRHSGSDRIEVKLTQRDNRIFVDVRDWGVGFNPATVEEQRFGLQGIRERVRLLDGQVVIDSSAGQGTHISVDLPLIDGGTASENPAPAGV